MNQEIRNGCFSSSEIVALTTVGKREMTPAELAGRPKTGKGSSAKTISDSTILSQTAITYIKKKNYERRLGRSLLNASSGKPQQWGNLVEETVFGILPLSYTLNSQETLKHAQYGDFWVGSPDGFKLDAGKTVVDIKCPYTHLSFCDLVAPLYEGLLGNDAMAYIRANHDEGDTYYWQLVSNAIIGGCDHAELIIYMPYLSEINDLRAIAEGNPECGWVQWALDLPYLPDNCYYKNLNIIRFDIPQEDKDFLTECVVNASKQLTERFIS